MGGAGIRDHLGGQDVRYHDVEESGGQEIRSGHKVMKKKEDQIKGVRISDQEGQEAIQS